MKLFGNKRHGAQRLVRTTTARKKKKRLSGLQRGLILLGSSILFLALVLLIGCRIVVSPPQLITMSGNSHPSNDDDLVGVSSDSGRKEDFYNILIVGTDDDGSRTDTIIIARLDCKKHTVSLMSVPRDTLVSTKMIVPKINGIYGANGGGADGMEALKKELERICGFSVDGYALVDLKAFIELVDLVGGVNFNVPQRMYYADPTQDLYIDLHPGKQRLDGERAMQLVRFRSYVQADIQRTYVQQDFLTALAKQCLTVSNLSKIDDFCKIFQKNVLTDLTGGNIIYLATELLSCDFDQMKSHTLPGTEVWIGDGSYYRLDAEQVLAIVNEDFNPYDQEIITTYLLEHSSGGRSPT